MPPAMILGAIAAALAGQSAAAQSFAHRSWTNRDHAPPFVQALTQDRQGFLWIGSIDGLYRFDGTEFEKVEPPAGHRRSGFTVSALATAPDGTIWIGYAGQGGVAFYRKGRIYDARLPDPPGEITFITVLPDNEPWIGAGDGTYAILRRHAGRWIPVFPTDGPPFAEAEPALVARNGSLWITTWSDGLFYRLPGETHPRRAPFLPRGGATLTQTPDGSLWLVDRNGMRRLPAWDRGDRRPVPSPSGDLPPARFFRAATSPRLGSWATTGVSGAFRFDGTTGAVRRFTEAEGLSSDRASPIIADRAGAIWIGTEEGLDRLSSPALVEEEKIPRNARAGYALTETGGVTYLGSGASIWQARPGRPLRLFRTVNGTIGNMCAGAGGTVWASLSDRLVQVAGSAVGTVVRLPRAAVDHQTCAVAADGRLWSVSDRSGLLQRQGNAWHRIALPIGSGDPGEVTLDSRGRPFVLLDRRRIARIDGSRVTIWDGDRIGFERPTAIAALGNDMIVGGLTGLLLLGEHRFAKLDIRDHPWLTDVRGIAHTPDGQSWLLTYHGVYRVETALLRRAFADPHAPLPHAMFDQEDAHIAMPQRDDGPQATSDGGGRLWLLTRRGVLRGDPGAASPSTGRFLVFIRSVTADGRDYRRSGGIDLPVGTASVTVRYGALDLATASQRRFRTRLVGVGRGWSDDGDRREVTFAGLPPGRYRFEVETSDPSGGWQSQGAALSFRIAPAFWQTWWFATLAVVLAGILAWRLLVWRLNLERDRARGWAEAQMGERERIARELHDTLLQGVQGLLLRFQAIAGRMASPSTDREAIEAALERGDDVLAEGRDRVRGLRHATGSTDFAVALRTALPADDIPVITSVLGRSRPVAAPVVEEIAAIVAEAVVNARRHAQAGRIDVRIRYGRFRLRVEVRDDGIGLPPDVVMAGRREGRFGLVGMRERARQVRARLAIGAGGDGGTSVTLSVPARVAYRDTV